MTWRNNNDETFYVAGLFVATVHGSRGWKVELDGELVSDDSDSVARIIVAEGNDGDDAATALRALSDIAHETLRALPAEFRDDAHADAEQNDLQLGLEL